MEPRAPTRIKRFTRTYNFSNVFDFTERPINRHLHPRPVSSSKSVSTRLLLLTELHRRRHGKLKPLADRLGVTVQAVSVVLKRLRREGLVELRDAAWRPTQRGTEAVHRSMRDLRRFVDDAIGNLRLIEECVAQADGPIRVGDEVGLFMRQGRLCAAPRVYAGSHGRALSAGRKGELVRVGNLSGIVGLRPAPLTFVAHPEFPSESQLRRAKGLLTRTRSGAAPHRVGAHELSSTVLLERLGRAPDFEYAPLAAAIDAVRRGVPVQYWVPARDLPDCLVAVSQANGSSPQALTVRSVEL